jgi:hypothetical protein
MIYKALAPAFLHGLFRACADDYDLSRDGLSGYHAGGNSAIRKVYQMSSKVTPAQVDDAVKAVLSTKAALLRPYRGTRAFGRAVTALVVDELGLTPGYDGAKRLASRVKARIAKGSE